jgi:hypothetical protein
MLFEPKQKAPQSPVNVGNNKNGLNSSQNEALEPNSDSMQKPIGGLSETIGEGALLAQKQAKTMIKTV